MKEDILKAYRFLRKNEQSIPDHVLDFMLNTSLEAIEKPKMTDLKKELLRFKDIVDGILCQADKKIRNSDALKQFELTGLRMDASMGVNAIIELAEELEKDND